MRIGILPSNPIRSLSHKKEVSSIFLCYITQVTYVLRTLPPHNSYPISRKMKGLRTNSLNSQNLLDDDENSIVEPTINIPSQPLIESSQHLVQTTSVAAAFFPMFPLYSHIVGLADRFMLCCAGEESQTLDEENSILSFKTVHDSQRDVFLKSSKPILIKNGSSPAMQNMKARAVKLGVLYYPTTPLLSAADTQRRIPTKLKENTESREERHYLSPLRGREGDRTDFEESSRTSRCDTETTAEISGSYSCSGSSGALHRKGHNKSKSMSTSASDAHSWKTGSVAAKLLLAGTSSDEKIYSQDDMENTCDSLLDAELSVYYTKNTIPVEAALDRCSAQSPIPLAATVSTKKAARPRPAVEVAIPSSSHLHLLSGVSSVSSKSSDSSCSSMAEFKKMKMRENREGPDQQPQKNFSSTFSSHRRCWSSPDMAEHQVSSHNLVGSQFGY